jgi:hypothetical protein
MILRLTVLLFSLPALLGGCGNSPDTPLPNYLERLQRTLDRPIEPIAHRLAPLPRPRLLRIELETTAIDLLDMLALGDCALAVTIGKANSSLGKLARDSQKLLLELEFLERVPGCIAELRSRDKQELAATLLAARERKHRDLPARIWNATLGGPEFRSFWKRPLHLHGYPAATGGEVPTALEELHALVEAWMSGQYLVGHARLEELLGTIRSGDGGSLLAAQEAQQLSLTAATAAVRERLDGSALCFDNRPSEVGRILDNVVRKYFVGEVQPWSVALARRENRLLAPLLALESSLASVLPAHYRAWRQERDTVFTDGASAPGKHARAIADLLETCGLRPGSETP